MKKILALAIAVASFCSFGQNLSKDFTVTAGQPYAVVDGQDKQYFPVGDGSVISIKTRGAIVTVQKFDAEGMKEVSRNTYEDFPKYNKVQRVVQTTKGLFYIYEAYNKKAKTFTVYARKVNTDDASFESNDALFTTSRPVVGQPVDAQGKAPIIASNGLFNFGKKFQVFQSFDKSKVLIQSRLKPLEKSDAKNHDDLGFYVFDAEMSEIAGNEVKMPYTEKEMNNLAYTVDSEGKTIMLAYLRAAKKFELLRIDTDGELEQIPVDLNGDLLFQKFFLTEDKSGDIMIAGVYANGMDVKVNWTGASALSFNANGIYSFKMSKDGEVSDAADIEFPLEVIRKYLSERQQKKLAEREKKGNAGIEDLRMVEFIQQEDGSAIVVCEQQYVREEMVMTSTQTVYHYANMIVSKINADGSVAWMKKLPKNQHGTCNYSWNAAFFEGQMGIKYVSGNGSHYILFVDNPKNENLGLNKPPAGHKNGAGGYLTAFKIDDADGSVERHTIAKLEDLDGVKAYQFKVTRICEVKEKTFLLEVYLKGKKDGMVKIELND